MTERSHFTQQPASTVACVGSTAQFTIDGKGFVNFGAIQWQRRDPGQPQFSNLFAESNFTYTTPPVTLADDDAAFRAVFTGFGNNNATSSVVTLSVLDPTNGVPRITGVQTNGTGGLLITGTGAANQSYSIQAATDLSNWVWRATVTATGAGLWSFLEANIATPPYRFYRLLAAPQMPGGLVNWWRADGNYLDSFGGFDGTPINNLGFTNGQRGLAFNLDGTNHSIHIGGGALPTPWTAGFWVKRRDAAGVSAALITDAASGLKLEQAGTPRRVGFTQFGVADYSFNYAVPTNVWTHLTFVAAAGGTILYTNGVVVGTSANTVALPRFTLGALINGSGDKLKGQLDETTLFNRALTPAEIRQVINATRGP